MFFFRLPNKWKSITSIPGRQRKTASHSHGSEDRIGGHHKGQVYAEMIKKQASNTFSLGGRCVIFGLHRTKTKVFVDHKG